jgi:hypothetical protein
MPENRDKGYERGGASGMEGELSDESVDMNRNQEKNPRQPENVGRQVLDRGQGRMDDSGMDADLPSERSRAGSMGRTGADQGQQRGGLRREPDLEGAEEKTGHEVD